MPVFRQTYRQFNGEARQRFRWTIVLEQELRVLWSFRIFKVLCLLALLHFLLRALQVFAYDVVRQDPNNLLTPLINQVQFLVINRTTFLDFIRLQIPLVFLTSLYAGSGMICNDFKNNLMEVYFSKPMTWLDYVLGKVLTLVVVGLGMTALPCLVLVIMHNILLPSKELLLESWTWPIAILGFSMIAVLSCSLAVLASSAMLRSQGYAAISIFMLIIANSAISGLLAGLLREKDYLVLSYPLVINELGQEMFRAGQPTIDLAWYWPAAYVAGVCTLFLVILTVKIRRAEVAA